METLFKACWHVQARMVMELVDDHDDQKQEGQGDRGQGDVPASARAPLVEHDTVANLGLNLIDELTARTLGAAVLVLLEGLGDAKESQESDHDGDESKHHEENQHHAGHGHAKGKDDLVADGVKQEHHKDGGGDESQEEGDHNESLSKLDDGVGVGGTGAGVLLEGGGLELSIGGLGVGAETIEVVVNLGEVKLSGGRNLHVGAAGALRPGDEPEVPVGGESGYHKSEDNQTEED